MVKMHLCGRAESSTETFASESSYILMTDEKHTFSNSVSVGGSTPASIAAKNEHCLSDSKLAK